MAQEHRRCGDGVPHNGPWAFVRNPTDANAATLGTTAPNPCQEPFARGDCPTRRPNAGYGQRGHVCSQCCQRGQSTRQCAVTRAGDTTRTQKTIRRYHQPQRGTSNAQRSPCQGAAPHIGHRPDLAIADAPEADQHGEVHTCRAMNPDRGEEAQTPQPMLLNDQRQTPALVRRDIREAHSTLTPTDDATKRQHRQRPTYRRRSDRQERANAGHSERPPPPMHRGERQRRQHSRAAVERTWRQRLPLLSRT